MRVNDLVHKIQKLPPAATWIMTGFHGQPGVSPGSATYGVVGATRIDSREVQLALKFVF
jgi:hypothetical protein